MTQSDTHLNPPNPYAVPSLTAMKTQNTLKWDQPHTQDTGVYVIPKNSDVPLLECKIPGVRKVGFQFEGSHFATMPLSSQKQLVGLKRE